MLIIEEETEGSRQKSTEKNNSLRWKGVHDNAQSFALFSVCTRID